MRNELSCIEKDFFPEEIENIFSEILIPKNKPITVGIIYRPPNQNNFLQTLIPLCQRQFLMMSRIIFNFAMSGLTQIIKSPTRIMCRSTSLIDHILLSP